LTLLPNALAFETLGTARSTDGQGTAVFLLDTGVSNNKLVAGSIDLSGSGTTADQSVPTHGNTLAKVIKGIAPATKLYNVKMGTSALERFPTSNLVKAFEYVVNHSAPGAKIINISVDRLVFGANVTFNSNARCVLTELCRRAVAGNITIVRSLGNDARRVANDVPIALEIGAHDPILNGEYPRSSLSNFFDQDNYLTSNTTMDGPSESYIDRGNFGTSISASYATGGVARAMSRYPTQLMGQPHAAIRYLVDQVSLVNGERKIMDLRRIDSSIPTVGGSFPNYPGCAPLKELSYQQLIQVSDSHNLTMSFETSSSGGSWRSF
jgi:hypothetical protein